MFDRISIGVRDLAHARRFYDAVLEPPGYRPFSEEAGILGYGNSKVALWIGQVNRPVPADEGSNLHF